MIGYSGGAIASEWAAELAPTYAPDVNQKLIGSAIGTAASYQSSAVAYRVTARMDSGAMRTIDYRNPPQVRIGDRVNFDGQQFYR